MPEILLKIIAKQTVFEILSNKFYLSFNQPDSTFLSGVSDE